VGVFPEFGAVQVAVANVGAGTDADAGVGAGAGVDAYLGVLVLRAPDGSYHQTCADAGSEGCSEPLVEEGDR